MLQSHSKVYGLAETTRLWFLHLTDLHSKLGYKTSTNDKGVIYRTTPDGLVLILLHIDDMLVMSCKDKYCTELKDYPEANLGGITPQEGPIISFVALHIHQHADHIIVDRNFYVRKLSEKQYPLCKFKSIVLHPIKPNATDKIDTPSLSEHAITSPIMEMRYMDDVRPDIKFATSFLTMRMSKPTIALKKQADYLLNYLGSSNDLSIRIAPSNEKLHAYVDAS